VDWNDLRYFLAVRRAGTLAGAARALKVEHSTVSRRLTALEEALGARLFLRGPDGFTSTPAGDRLLPLAEQMEAAVGAIDRQVAGGDERVDGTVRLTVSEVFSGFIVKRLGRLRARHPDLVVEVLTGTQALDLSRGEADLAVRIMATSDPDLTVRKIIDCGWAMYAAAGYVDGRGAPASPEALAGHEIIGYDDTMSAVPGAQWLTKHGAGANVVLRGNSIMAALNACIAGMGLTVLPCFLADVEPTLVRLSPAVLGTRPMFLVVHPDLARVARVRVVMDFIVEIMTGEAALLQGVVGAPAGS
jgi:DNA-binding transcriptional LysR family regulator